MAITFSNNASGEMRRNVLEWLKLLCLKDPDRLAGDGGGHRREARSVSPAGRESSIENILSRFSEFQVRTIDSFMASVFRASALDFGFGPDFEVVLDAQPLVDYAWNLFLREAPAGSGNARLLDRTIASVLDFKTSSGSYRLGSFAATPGRNQEGGGKARQHGRDAHRGGPRAAPAEHEQKLAPRFRDGGAAGPALGPGAERQLDVRRQPRRGHGPAGSATCSPGP